MKSNQFKMASAGVGACAVIAMGALGLAFSDVSAAEAGAAAAARPGDDIGNDDRGDG